MKAWVAQVCPRRPQQNGKVERSHRACQSLFCGTWKLLTSAQNGWRIAGIESVQRNPSDSEVGRGNAIGTINLADVLNLRDIDTVHIQGLKQTGRALTGTGKQARQEREYVDGHHTG
jgi:hypothetical protein